MMGENTVEAKAPTRVAVVEDDHEIRDLVVAYLDREGFAPRGFANGSDFDKDSHAFDPELIVLDLMMPGEDGLSICRRIAPTTPILILSAKGEEVDRIVGLEVGADDYLPKPFNPRELVARIRAILRRRAQSAPLPLPLEAESRVLPTETPISVAREILTFDSWTLDIGGRRLTAPSQAEVPLSSGEFALLTEFARRPGVVLSREQLLDWTRGHAADSFDRAIDVQLSRLRRKMASGGGADLIKTIRGDGYVFAAEVRRVEDPFGKT